MWIVGCVGWHDACMHESVYTHACVCVCVGVHGASRITGHNVNQWTPPTRAEMELFPGGGAECVAFETREAYCDLLADYHLHEYDAQVGEQ